MCTKSQRLVSSLAWTADTWQQKGPGRRLGVGGPSGARRGRAGGGGGRWFRILLWELSCFFSSSLRVQGEGEEL